MNILDLFLHLDIYLGNVVSTFGIWTYVILFLIIFIETGIVVIPFLPGDSLLFVVGALFAAQATQSLGPNFIWTAMVLMTAAAIIGDTVNFHIGKAIGPKIFKKEDTRVLNKKNLIKANEFYKKHGGKVIIMARFIPVIRDFAPFVAGIGVMNYKRFILFNIIGGVAWVTAGVTAGYFFGNIPFIKANFSLVILAIVFVSCIPMAVTYLQQRSRKSGHEQQEKISETLNMDKFEETFMKENTDECMDNIEGEKNI